MTNQIIKIRNQWIIFNYLKRLNEQKNMKKYDPEV